MKNAWIILFLFTFSSTVFGQSLSDTIQIKMGPKFIQHGQRLSYKQLLEATQSNTLVYNEIKTAKRNLDIGNVFGFIGGVFVGIPAGIALANGEADWTLALVGVGFVGVSLPFSIKAGQQSKRAVRSFNQDLGQTGASHLRLNVDFAPNGVQLRLTF